MALIYVTATAAAALLASNQHKFPREASGLAWLEKKNTSDANAFVFAAFVYMS